MSDEEIEKGSGIQEVSKAPVREGALQGTPIGATGLVHQSGYVHEEFLPALMGRRAVEVYKEMEANDPVVGAMFFSIDMFLRKVIWNVQAVDETPKGEEDKKFLEECKDDMSSTWADFVSEVNTMLPHGWSYFEILYKRRSHGKKANGEPESKFDDGKIGWRKLDPRSQDSMDRWKFDEEDGGLMGMYQRPAPDYRERFIPIEKSLLFRTTSRKNNPEGRSVLRNAYRPYFYKKRMEEIEGIGVERDLAGLPMAEVPAKMLRQDASDDEKAMLRSIMELVKNVRRDRQEGIVWPQSYDQNGIPQFKFSLLSAGGTRQFNTGDIITRYEQRIAMTVLADFILLGNDSQGSFAMATSKSGMFQAALSSWLDTIADVLNNYAVPRLFRLNGVEGPYPKFSYEPVQEPSLADLATYVAALAGAGAQLFPDTDLENHFRKRANLPLREDKDDSSVKEKDLRDKTLDAQIAMQEMQQKQAKNPQLLQQIQQMRSGQAQKPMGKDPQARPGAPTKTTGKVKSKLPPQQRRRTASVNASENVKKLDTAIKEKMKRYLAKNYPNSVLNWVDEATWHGPMDVNLEDIKMDRRPGGRDPEKVKSIAEAIDDGKPMSPVVLVMTPDALENGGLRIADGYHRTLGFKHSSQSYIPAYVAVVDEENGEWDRKMHDAKLNKREKNPEANAESMKIRENKKLAENQKPHKFKAAKWTHPNGHPRCVRCGDEEPESGMCDGAVSKRVRIRRAAS